MLKRALVATVCAAGVLAGGAVTAGTASAAPTKPLYVGKIDGYHAWEYGPYSLKECKTLARDRAVRVNSPTPKFGKCYVSKVKKGWVFAAKTPNII